MRDDGAVPPSGRPSARDGGVRFAERSGLVAAALELLDGGGRRADVLAREVLGVREAPPALAFRLVDELLGGDPRVAVDAAGVWRLRRLETPAAETPLRELEYAVVDVETTGGGPGNGGRITEIAVVRVCDGEVTGEFSTLVRPGVPITPWVSRLTGISERMVADAPPFEEVCGLVRREIEGRIFVAHNAAFDWRFVCAEMRRAESLLPLGPRLCTLRWARRALPGVERAGLDALAHHFGLEVEGRHRAAGDARATALILLRLVEASERRGHGTWGDLQGWLHPGRPRSGRRPGAERRPC